MNHLPKVQHPTFNFEIPSSKKTIRIRPMTAREEKILLLAKETKEQEDILQAIKQVCNNCIIDEKFDIDQIAIFDLEMLFIKLRSISISNIIGVAYTDTEDEQEYKFDIDLNAIEVKYNEQKNTIVVDKSITINLKCPEVSLYSDERFIKATQSEAVDFLVQNCIQSVISDGSIVHSFKDAPDEEKKEFLDNMPILARQKLIEYIQTLPTIYYKIEYTNKNGNERKIELKALTDFFSWH